ncbi:MAG: type II toxin-antitoxin system ParD family antitoxin [Burkholderiales bacterium]|nr:type II toxin-antitoxin system ParD family antitoxin [Burkholderiales bacterium]
MRTKTPTMNVSLTDALRDVVDERLRSGLYGNASEHVRNLIRRDEETVKHLRELYQVGIDSGESVPMSCGDWAALRTLASSPATGQA